MSDPPEQTVSPWLIACAIGAFLGCCLLWGVPLISELVGAYRADEVDSSVTIDLDVDGGAE